MKAEPLHDWIGHAGETPQWVVRIGPRKRHPALTWRAPAEGADEAVARARADCDILWRACLGLSGATPGRASPLIHAKAEAHSEAGGPVNLIKVHAPFQDAIRASGGQWPPVPDRRDQRLLEERAADAVLAAASRAVLPAGYSLVEMEYGEASDAPRSGGTVTLQTCVTIPNDVRWIATDGPLRAAAIAIGAARALRGDGAGGGAAAIWPPESATLRAAFLHDLKAQAPARAGRVAEHLRKLGLDAEADAFLAAYGRADA